MTNILLDMKTSKLPKPVSDRTQTDSVDYPSESNSSNLAVHRDDKPPTPWDNVDRFMG